MESTAGLTFEILGLSPQLGSPRMAAASAAAALIADTTDTTDSLIAELEADMYDEGEMPLPPPGATVLHSLARCSVHHPAARSVRCGRVFGALFRRSHQPVRCSGNPLVHSMDRFFATQRVSCSLHSLVHVLWLLLYLFADIPVAVAAAYHSTAAACRFRQLLFNQSGRLIGVTCAGCFAECCSS